MFENKFEAELVFWRVYGKYKSKGVVKFCFYQDDSLKRVKKLLCQAHLLEIG